ncbi:electron transport complex subunit RsxD [Alteromonas oceanisediminis]|uniref:electron transport complex subunit RsxD n=1 Tax=Alteromonas oceanisediminis TaxID=2836180 RepID=UPI001BD986A6|nr:electron transport complex subunit RsxD [Alteromonas oceanisediminis]MBT0584807.1 electron transport complex subunit RsxD [Alteromonas oceanisediminis]
MKLSLRSSPHQHVRRDTGAVMRLVCYAALPGIAAQVVFFGWGVIVQLILAITTAILAEAAVLLLRKKSLERTLSDYSALLTALLLAISIPPLAPWWVIVIGSVFAIVVVKQLYGGLGYNMFNPAMAAYIMLLISFPVQMTQWLPPQSIAENSASIIDAASVVFTGFTLEGYSIAQLQVNADGVTMATPLDSVKTALLSGQTYSESLNSPMFNGAAGKGWLWVSIAYLVGGLALIKLRVISWHIPGSLLLAVAATSLMFYAVSPDNFASPYFHLVNGSAIIGAFFIATDPVSASTTPRGRMVFGALIGFWIVIIRLFGNYPDAVAFAVVIMNMAVPLIDYYTQPRTYGHSRRSR